MVLDKDFKEFIELLNAHNVKYLIVGGYAVNFHGYPRYTKDIDFWIWIDKNNISNLLKAIGAFGFNSLGLTEEDFLNPENVVQLGFEPYRIDLMVDIEGADFNDCYQRKSSQEIDQTNVDFLNIDDLIKVKRKSGRLQDLADAEQLEQIKNKQEE